MSDVQSTDTDRKADAQQPEFRGCIFCYSAEWALYAGRKTYRKLTRSNRSHQQ